MSNADAADKPNQGGGPEGCGPWKELAGAYALDALDDLDDLERRRFEGHLVECADCRREVGELQEAAGLLGSANEVAPPAELKAGVMDLIGSTPQVEPVERVGPADRPPEHQKQRQRPMTGRPLLLAAAALMLVASAAALLAAGLLQNDPSAYAQLAAEDDAVITSLAATGPETAGTVTVAWSPGRDEIGIEADDLPAPPDGQVYALWLLADGDPIPAALFTPADGSVSAVESVADRPSLGWAVTIEPAGGSDLPTSDILYLAQL
jgi:anti-sigma factor RsiW